MGDWHEHGCTNRMKRNESKKDKRNDKAARRMACGEIFFPLSFISLTPSPSHSHLFPSLHSFILSFFLPLLT